MICVNNTLNITLKDRKNYRAFSKLNNLYLITIFPEKKIYMLDNNFQLLSTIETSYFYGDVKPASGDLLICGCYSSLNTEIHIINKKGEILEKYNYYKLMDKEDKDIEQFISFCQSSFLYKDKIYFTLKESQKIYCIEETKKLSFLEFSSIFGTNYKVECAHNYNDMIYCILNCNQKFFLLKTKSDKSEMHIKLLDEKQVNNSICNCFIDNRDFYIVNGSIKESDVKLLFKEI